MKTVIIVNRNISNYNKAHGTDYPAISVHQSGKPTLYAHELAGNGRFRFVTAEPGKSLSCGATIWFETDATVVRLLRGAPKEMKKEKTG